jgi:regulator of RNase E activity RraA
MSAPLADRLHALYTSAVHDVMRAMGRDRFVLPPGIRALDPAVRLAGEAWTVRGHVDQRRPAHDTLLEWTGVLSRAPGGHVVVCQPNTDWIALMGELSAAALRLKGVRGYVVDGPVRDLQLLVDMGFPVFCRGGTPQDIVGRWVPDAFGQPVTIGEVTIAAGDYVLGDRDGVVAIPREVAEEVVARTEEVARTENKVRSAILAGMDPQQAYLTYGKF